MSAAVLERPVLDRSAPSGVATALSFTLPPSLEAHEPPEARGLARDEVRLLVSSADDDSVVHARFSELPRFLRAGDVLVVNASATINAALSATRPGGEPIELHLSQRLPSGAWAVELRRLLAAGASAPLLTARAGERLALAGGGAARLLEPSRPKSMLGITTFSPAHGPPDEMTRLWRATIEVPGGDVLRHLDAFGSPIRYPYVHRAWPLSYYQTIFASEPGSAEMPSAGRAFTPALLARLRARRVAIAPIVLHTGVASLEAHEPPYAEYYRVSAASARVVNQARAEGGRVVAVGTTVVRALETVTSPDGVVRVGEGWTELVVTPERGVYAVDALLTGFHEPRASHLAMLEALAGRRHLEMAYAEALRERYLWHEFGDLHLLVRGDRR